MRAGQMRDVGTGVKLTTTQSSITGAAKKTYSDIGTFHFFRKTIQEQKALLQMQEGSVGQIIIECRIGPCTKAMTHIKYKQQLYRIESKIENQEQHSYNITAKLVKQ